MKSLHLISRLALVGLMLSLATGAAAQSLSSVAPPRVAAGAGQTITIFGSGIGHPGDLVDFPGGPDVSPTATGAGWTTVEVPRTWSGTIRVKSGATGTWSDTLDLEISFSLKGNQWASESQAWYLNGNGAPGCSVDDTRVALSNGTWAWDFGSNMTFSYQGTTSNQGNSLTDGLNVHIWTSTGWSSGAIANLDMTYDAGTGDIWEFDVFYNAQHHQWSCSGELGKKDVGNVGTSMIGRSIGLSSLDGAVDSEKTMYRFTGSGETLKRTLHYDDVLGAEFIYPRPGRPDFVAAAPTGWWGPITPSNVPNATADDALITSVLDGTTLSYFNVSHSNAGLDGIAPQGSHELFLDDEFSHFLNWGGVIFPGATSGLFRNNPILVRGGRHTLRVDYDSANTAFESNENNNSYAVQAVYSPYDLTDLTPISRTQPPVDGIMAAPNCDGFRFVGNWWGAVGVLPTDAADDYDMYLYNDYSSSTVGFSNILENSFSGPGQSDFVLVNGNSVGENFTRYAGAASYDAPVGSTAVIQQSNAVGSTLVPTPNYGAEATSGSVTIGVDDILRVHEVFLNDPALNYRFTLDNLSGTADLNFSLYDATGDYFGKWDNLEAGVNSDGGGDEYFEYSPTAAGYFAVVVWKNDSEDAPLSNTYELRVGKALSNLNATLISSQFDYPVTVRTSPNATVFSAMSSPVLNGNASSYVNWATYNAGPYDIPAWNTQAWLDSETLVSNADWTDSGVAFYMSLNRSVSVRGGRHTLEQRADPGFLVPESDESDNVAGQQYVFSPLATVKDVSTARLMPPPRGLGVLPNSDGFSYAPVPTESWVVAMASRENDDYDLRVYNDYSGSTAGFSNQIGSSSFGSRDTEFVVGHFSDGNDNLYSGVVHFFAPQEGGFVLDQSDTGGHSAFATGNFTETLGVDQVVDVYQALLVPGETYSIRLERLAGSENLRVAVFPSVGIHGRDGGLAYSNGLTANMQGMEFTATASTWYPIVVYRVDGSNLGESVPYHLSWIEESVSAVPTEAPTQFSFRGGYPNPSPGNSMMRFALPTAGPVQMSVLNVRGQRIKTLISETMSAGDHQRAWDGRDDQGGTVASGTYWVRLEAAGKMLTQKVTLIR